jgi:PTH1 family peptidyl-tRNA hydrolase
MKLIVGLGNPGKAYQGSRHNLGSLIIRTLCKRHKVSLKKDIQTLSLCGKTALEGQKIILALPLVFMNVSGAAVKVLLKKSKIGLKDLLVICDDLDLELGRLKIRPEGSSGGHRGLSSIATSLNSREFARLRLGIGRPRLAFKAAGYVLSRFSRAEQKQLKAVVEKACDCCDSWVTQGLEKSMNIFNRQSAR